MKRRKEMAAARYTTSARHVQSPKGDLDAIVMKALRKVIRGCPEPYEVKSAGHFVQEWGAEVAKKALAAFGLIKA